MTREVREKIGTKTCQFDPCFEQRKDFTGEKGAIIDLKLTAAIFMNRDNRKAFSLIREYRISEPHILRFMKRSIRAVVLGYDGEPLRLPNVGEIFQIEKHFKLL